MHLYCLTIRFWNNHPTVRLFGIPTGIKKNVMTVCFQSRVDLTLSVCMNVESTRTIKSTRLRLRPKAAQYCHPHIFQFFYDIISYFYKFCKFLSIYQKTFSHALSKLPRPHFWKIFKLLSSSHLHQLSNG